LISNKAKVLEKNVVTLRHGYRELQERHQAVTRSKVKTSELYNQLKRKYDKVAQESMIRQTSKGGLGEARAKQTRIETPFYEPFGAAQVVPNPSPKDPPGRCVPRSDFPTAIFHSAPKGPPEPRYESLFEPSKADDNARQGTLPKSIFTGSSFFPSR
jgi:hypothetical protein